MCPFRLSGAPATFQRYINRTLQRELDKFVTVYLDDILVYFSGSYKNHIAKVRRVLGVLAKAGLSLDPKKCEFAIKEVKYLGFIITAGKGISYNLKKQQAICK